MNAHIPNFEQALKLLNSGNVIVMPTETVYGLAGDACNDLAVQKIFQLKGRPSNNPLIVHVPNKEVAQRYVEWNDVADTLAEAFWPGPLTLVLPKKEDCPVSSLVSAGGDTLAIRMPKHPIARAVLEEFDGGIAAPSANRSGRVSATCVMHVVSEFPDEDLLILDGEECEVGIESTVMLCEPDRQVILRAGSITAAMIEEQGVELDIRKVETAVPQSPGLLTSHYAPSIPVRIHAEEVESHEALIAFGPRPLSGAAVTLNLSPSADLEEAATQLFATMRALDKPDYSAIAVMSIPNEGIGVAINDRLRRAAAEK